MTKIYCNNIDCENISPISPHIRPRRLFEETYAGICSGKILINRVDLESSKVSLSYGICAGNEIDFRCNQIDCLFNDCSGKLYGNCMKDEIYIDKVKIQGEILWICKSFSNTKISGHMDMMRLVDSDGHPKYGGHLSDLDSEHLAQDNSVFRSYSTHHRESKELKRIKRKDA